MQVGYSFIQAFTHSLITCRSEGLLWVSNYSRHWELNSEQNRKSPPFKSLFSRGVLTGIFISVMIRTKAQKFKVPVIQSKIIFKHRFRYRTRFLLSLLIHLPFNSYVLLLKEVLNSSFKCFAVCKGSL